MAKVIEKKCKTVQACELGTKSEMELKLMKTGNIQFCRGMIPIYKIYSQKDSGKREIAKKGDFVKIDEEGFPYTIHREYFLKNHSYIEENTYEELPQVYVAWESTEEITEEIQFLIANNRLRINTNNYEKFFLYKVNGNWINKAADAVIVFYDIRYDENGSIVSTKVDLIEREKFLEKYRYC